MSYSALKNYLNANYRRIHGNLKDYYLDQEGRVVATLQCLEDGTKLITTFINDERGELNSHYNKVTYSVCNKIDQPMVDILLGRANDTTINKGQICFYDNLELNAITEKYNTSRSPQYNLGSIGTIIIKKDGEAKFLLGETRKIEGIKVIPSQNNTPTHLCAPSGVKMRKISNNRN